MRELNRRTGIDIFESIRHEAEQAELWLAGHGTNAGARADDLFAPKPPEPAKDFWDSIHRISGVLVPRISRPIGLDVFQAPVDYALSLCRRRGIHSPLSVIDLDVNVTVRIVPTNSVHVRVIKAPAGDFLICIDRGLVQAVETLTNLSYWRESVELRLESAIGVATGAYNPSGQVDEELVDRTLRAYLAVVRVSGMVGLPLYVSVTDVYKVLARAVAQMTIEFILFHELAHVIGSHHSTIDEPWSPEGGEPVSALLRDEQDADYLALSMASQLALDVGEAGRAIAGQLRLISAANAVSISALLQTASIAVERKSHLSGATRSKWMRELIEHEWSPNAAAKAFGDDANEISRVQEVTRWLGVVMPNKWAPRSAHHLLNCLPRGGAVDFSLYDQSGQLAPPDEDDEFAISSLITLAEEQYRKASLSSYSLAADLGATLFGDIYSGLPESAQDQIKKFVTRVPPMGPDASADLEAFARTHAAALAGQHWFFKCFIQGIADEFEGRMDVLSARGLSVDEIASLPERVAPNNVRAIAVNLFGRAKLGDNLDVSTISDDVYDAICKGTGIE